MLATTTAVEATSTMLMITGRSCWVIAVTAVVPRPGRLKVFSLSLNTRENREADRWVRAASAGRWSGSA